MRSMIASSVTANSRSPISKPLMTLPCPSGGTSRICPIERSIE